MTTYPESEAIDRLINDARRILIIQPDNPDGDSLGSSLALEHILGGMGKEVIMFSGVTMPSYLKYIKGYDRVETVFRQKFDLSIIVDTSSNSLLENVYKQLSPKALGSRPSIIIDHHDHNGGSDITFASVRLNVPTAAATAEVIYELSVQLDWKLNLDARNAIAASILSDSQGLTADKTSSRTVHIIGELVEGGVSLSGLENARRDTMRKSPEIVKYKGRLLERIEYLLDNRLALLVIPWEEIQLYSPQYNPAMLALEDMRLTNDTLIAVVLKVYNDGRITGKIRSNYGTPIAGELASLMGGGGHDYASGFKLPDADLQQVRSDVIRHALELLA